MEQREERSGAVFLDRDGTLMPDVNYCADPEQVHAFAEAAAALTRLKGAGIKLIVVTNQSGIGRGYFSEQQYRAVEAELERQLGPGLIDAAYFCPHAPAANCRCRKPAPEMLARAATEHAIDLSRSYMIGDKPIDAQCGRNAGTRTILVQTGQENHARTAAADFVARDLTEAADIILRHGF